MKKFILLYILLITGCEEPMLEGCTTATARNYNAEANVDDYVFMTVSKSMIPEQRSYPFRRLIVIQFTLIGGILSVLIVFLLRAFKH